MAVPLTRDASRPSVPVAAAETLGDPCGHEHYSQRAPWLRAAVLGANDGLVTVGALLTGIGAASSNQHQLLLSAVAALVSGVQTCAFKLLGPRPSDGYGTRTPYSKHEGIPA